MFLCNTAQGAHKAVLQLCYGFPVGTLGHTDVTEPELIWFTVICGQVIKFHTFPISGENFTELIVGGDRQSQPLRYGVAGVKCSFQIAGIHGIYMVVADDVVCGGFSLVFAEVGKWAVDMAYEYAIQIGAALSVANDEKLGHYSYLLYFGYTTIIG